MPKKKIAKKTAAKKTATKKTGGRPIGGSRAEGKTQISISVSQDLVEKIDKLAEAQNRNRSNYISNELERITAQS